MPWSEDRLTRAMQDIDPATTPVDASPRASEWGRMRTVMVSPPPRRRATLRPALRWALAVPTLAVVAALSLTIGNLTATPSYAATPPPLVAEPLRESIDQVIETSLQTLRAEPQTTATRDAEVVRWELRDDGGDDPVIVPEWQEWVWDDDGTGHLTATAGAPYSVTEDGQIVAPVGEAPTEGARIEPGSSQPTRYGYFPEEPPSEAAALRDYLQNGTHLAADADTLAWWGAISALRDEWTLTPAQQAAALQILDESGGLSVLGTVVDRFGREGIALSVTSRDREQFGATIVLDATSRQIIAADILYLGGIDRLDIEPDSVIQYSAWLLPHW